MDARDAADPRVGVLDVENTPGERSSNNHVRAVDRRLRVACLALSNRFAARLSPASAVLVRFTVKNDSSVRTRT